MGRGAIGTSDCHAKLYTGPNEGSRGIEAAQWALHVAGRGRKIAQQVEQNVEADSREWELHVTGIRLQDIDMPEELKKIMSRQAGAEREKRATITKAEGDKLAAENLAAAAAIMGASPGAMQLQTLQTIDGLGPSASNTVLLAVPIELMEFVKRLSHPS
jgi:regulator of protease activity HflC (stomatin/prohibitin superfamily)